MCIQCPTLPSNSLFSFRERVTNQKRWLDLNLKLLMHVNDSTSNILNPAAQIVSLYDLLAATLPPLRRVIRWLFDYSSMSHDKWNIQSKVILRCSVHPGQKRGH